MKAVAHAAIRRQLRHVARAAVARAACLDGRHQHVAALLRLRSALVARGTRGERMARMIELRARHPIWLEANRRHGPLRVPAREPVAWNAHALADQLVGNEL